MKLKDIISEDNREVDGRKISAHDFKSIGKMSDDEIYTLVLQKTGIDINEPASFEKINNLFHDSLKYLEEELYYKIPTRIKKIGSFETKKDVLDFLKFTNNPRGILNCVIAKTAITVNKIMYNERLDEIKAKTKAVFEKKLKAPLQINYTGDGFYRGEVTLIDGDGDKRRIPFICTEREKSDYSSVSKGNRDPEYGDAEIIGDFYGFTFKLQNKNDLLLLAQYVLSITYKKGIYDIKNKNEILFKDLEDNSTKINSDFLKRMSKSLKSNKKNITAKEYTSLKTTSPLGEDDKTKNLSLEIGFTTNFSNENGVSMHGNYVCSRKITERIRLEGSITEDEIYEIIMNFLIDLGKILLENPNRVDTNLDSYKIELYQDLLSKNYLEYELNSHSLGNIDRYLTEGLFKYYISNLINNGGNTFTSDDSEKVAKIVEH